MMSLDLSDTVFIRIFRIFFVEELFCLLYMKHDGESMKQWLFLGKALDLGLGCICLVD